ncbi:MAG: DUF302 domain-containing protein [Actinomycetota bacterium]
MTDYGYSVEVPLAYDEAVLQARLAFRGEGFSILSEMHVGGLLGAEAGEERQYLIMGVWNSAVSDKSVSPDLRVAVHLPCNVVVQEVGDHSVVAALDPADALEIPEQERDEVTAAARAAITRVLHKVGEPAA